MGFVRDAAVFVWIAGLLCFLGAVDGVAGIVIGSARLAAICHSLYTSDLVPGDCSFW